MRILIKCVLLFILVLWPLAGKTQFDPGNVCRVENGRIIFKFDLRWNEKQKKEIATLFELDSTLIEKAYNGSSEIISGGIKWKVKKIKTNFIELSIPVDDIDLSGTTKDINHANKDISKAKKEMNVSKNSVFLIDDSWIKDASAKERESAVYGVNNFTANSIFQYKNGMAHFYLPGFINAKKVYLAGAFNNWNTNETLMQKVDSGWITTMKLLPGNFELKRLRNSELRLLPSM